MLYINICICICFSHTFAYACSISRLNIYSSFQELWKRIMKNSIVPPSTIVESIQRSCEKKVAHSLLTAVQNNSNYNTYCLSVPVATFKKNLLHFLGNWKQPHRSFLFSFLIVIQIHTNKSSCWWQLYSFLDHSKVKILYPSHHNIRHNRRLCLNMILTLLQK